MPIIMGFVLAPVCGLVGLLVAGRIAGAPLPVQRGPTARGACFISVLDGPAGWRLGLWLGSCLSGLMQSP